MTSLMARETAEAAAVISWQLAANADATARLAAELRAKSPRCAVTVARGSSDHAALYLKYLIELQLGLPCASLGPSLASLYRAPLKLEGALALTISQSGGSPDLLAMQVAAQRAGAIDIALVNDAASPLALAATRLLPLHAGPELAVAATKSVLAAMACGAALVAQWGGDAALQSGLGQLQLGPETPAQALVDHVCPARSLYVLGRGPTYAVAAEAALKLKETCAIHAEAFSSAEVLHGPAGLVTQGFPVLAFVPQDAARAGMLETLARLAAMGASVETIDIAAAHPLLAPLAMLHRFYGLAEACARALGRDPDKPPHLSKVTRTL